MSGNEITVELLYEINKAFNSRDPDRIAAFFHEEGVFMTARGPEPCGTPVRGRAAIRKFLADRYAKIPDMHWDDEYRYVCGNRAVSCWIVTGKSEDGEELNYRGCDLYEFKDGLIISKDTYWKTVTK